MSTRTDPVGPQHVAATGPLIDAVFLTSNSCAQALECIDHLREPEIASIVMVDNASTDGTADAVRAAHPDVTVLGLDEPAGLATALNRGAELGHAPFILYLNDDVFAEGGAIGLLLQTLCGHDDAVAAGGRLVERDLTTQDRYRPRAFPSPATVAARLIGLERLWPRNPWTGRHLRRRLDDHTTVAVDQPAGACMLVRRSAVTRIGGWDERYWFWYEDVDFSRRLAAEGTQLYVPAAPFRHVGGSTARRLPRSEGHRRTFHGILLYAQTHFSPGGRAIVGLTLAAHSTARALMTARSDRRAARIYAAAARAAVRLAAGRADVGLRDAGPGTQPERLAAPSDAVCIVCGTPATVTDRFAPTLLGECGACGLLFRAGADEAGVRKMYEDDSYSRARIEAHAGHGARAARDRLRWTRERAPGRRLLEVGSGTGFFVAQAGEHGYDAIGVEPSALFAEHARTTLGADVRTGFLESADLPETDFDAVCMWHVLEHSADPLALLRDVRARLRPGGRLVLEVPNIASVGATMMRERWAHLDPDAHVCHFTPRSLSVALEAAGYELIELQTFVEGHYDHLAMRLRPKRIAGRAARAVQLRTLQLTHPSRGELLRIVAAVR